MARPSQPWWWKQRRSYYVVVGGERHRLGADREAAFAEWLQLLRRHADAAATGPTPTPQPLPLSLSAAADAYLTALPAWAQPATVKTSRWLLTALTKVVGRGAVVASLRVTDFAAAADAAAWNPSSRQLAKQRWRAFANWLVAAKLMAADPLAELRTPQAQPRGVEVLPTDAEVATLLDATRLTRPRLHRVLEALVDTGCRPSEVFRVTADQFDAAAATWNLRKRKTPKPRVVHLTPRVRAYCDEAAAKWPSGPLYRLRRGHLRTPDEESHYLTWTFSRLRKRLGLRRGITPYSLRHSFATTALAIGVPEAVAAELLGQSVDVLRRHYSHLAGRPDALRDALRRIRGG